MKKHILSAIAVFAVASVATGAPVIERLQQIIQDGTAANPAIAFISDQDTGFYKSAANTVGLAGGGAAILTFTPGTLALTKTAGTNSVTSATTAAAASTTVAALTFAPTATLDANDLVCEVNSAAGTSLLSVDLEGDTYIAGDLTAAGNGLTCSATGATCILTSAVVDGTTSGTVGAITLKASADITASDLVLDVQDSAANHILTVTEAGALTALTSVGATTDITLGGGDLTSSKVDQTFNVVSATNATTVTNAIAAITLAPSATLDANDLVLEVNAVSAGSAVLAVDLEGDTTIAGDVTAAGNGINCSGTGATCILTSAVNDDTTSSTVGAITLKASADINAADLVLDVQDTSSNHILTLTEAGALTALTTVTATTDMSLAGNDLTATGTGQTFNIVSATNATTASDSVGAFTIAPSATLDANDLVLDIDSVAAGGSILSLDKEGDLTLTGRIASAGTATIADSGDGNPAVGSVTPATRFVAMTCSDSDGCTVSVSETGAVNGTMVTIVNVSANTSTISDTGGVTEMAGNFAMGQFDSLTLVYATDTWVEVDRSDN